MLIPPSEADGEEDKEEDYGSEPLDGHESCAGHRDDDDDADPTNWLLHTGPEAEGGEAEGGEEDVKGEDEVPGGEEVSCFE
jgi:hypothetical protein